MPIGRLGFDWDQIKIKSYPLTPALSPKGRGGKGADRGLFSEPEFDTEISGRCTFNIHLGQSPLPPGGPTFREG